MTRKDFISRREVTLIVLPVLVALIAGCAGTRERAAWNLWKGDAGRASDPSAPGDTLSNRDAGLSGYLDLAIQRNRSVRAARQEWKAELERVPQARALPDPVLSYGFFLQEVETRVGPQKQRLGVSQSFPWFGTLGLRGDVALAAAEAARQRYRNVVQRTVREVAVAFAEYYYLGAALGITRGNMDLLRGWERILRARYTTGGVSYSDLIKVQVELGKLADRVTTLEQQRGPRMARLQAFLDLPPGTVIPWPEVLPPAPALSDRPRLQQLLEEENPELKALEAMVEREDRGLDLAGKAYFPDFTLGLDWVQTDSRDVTGLDDDGKDPLMARVAVRVPLWRGKLAAGRREALARREAAAERRRDRSNLLQSELEEFLFAHNDAERKVELFRDSLLPKGNQSLEAAFAAFEGGKGDFLAVLDAERVLLEFGLSLERARADLIRARAGLDALLGRGPAWK